MLSDEFCGFRVFFALANDLRYQDEANHRLDEQCTGFPLKSKT